MTKTEQADSKIILKALDNLTIAQEEELEEHPIPSNISEDGKALFDWFQQTPIFSQIYREAARYYLIPLPDQKISKLRGRLVGRIVTNLGYFVTAARQPAERVVLSPERTFEFYHLLYPEAPIMKDPLNNPNLEGITVPSGIVVEKLWHGEHIIELCRYTATADRIRNETSLLGLGVGRDKNRKLLDEAALTVVMPKFDDVDILDLPYSSSKAMPFRSIELGHFVDYICNNYSPDEDAATLRDLQIRARHQWNKAHTTNSPQEYIDSINPMRRTLIGIL